jgi:DNA-binding PucR family transcriptional regulator
VKYRMRVVREMLGSRLDDPAQRFDIELALRLCLVGRGIDVGSGATDR